MIGAGISVFAPAKVNLTLHITGQRVDGYHTLDTLVAFGGLGDHVDLVGAAFGGLSVTGPMAGGVPTGDDNLVTRVQALFPLDQPLAIRLVKRLPAAAGIGGGSADAAAAARGLIALGALGPDLADDMRRDGPQAPSIMEAFAAHGAQLAALGADIPMCFLSQDLRAQGTGDRLSSAGPLPPLPAVLVNPGVAVPTAKVFAALTRKDNAPMAQTLPTWADVPDLTGWLADQRNDLEAPARALAPEIDTVLDALAATKRCLFARMSGSGATCFGLYPDRAAAEAAAVTLRAAHPDWWVEPMVLGGQAGRVRPEPFATT